MPVTDKSKASKPANIEIIERCQKAFNNHPGPRLGDYIQIPTMDERQPSLCRVTHVWPDKLQTAGERSGSYHASGSGHLSYSGSLDPGIDRKHVTEVMGTRKGPCWIFDEGYPGAGRGVEMEMEFRIYSVSRNADLSGIISARPPFMLSHRRGIWYVTPRNGFGQFSFNAKSCVEHWLIKERLWAEELEVDGPIRLYWPDERPLQFLVP